MNKCTSDQIIYTTGRNKARVILYVGIKVFVLKGINQLKVNQSQKIIMISPCLNCY